MTVQELFKSINEDEFVDIYLKNDNETINLIFNTDLSLDEKVEKIEKFKNIVLDALRLFKTMEIERNDEYIVFSIPRYDGDAIGDSFLTKREEILNIENIDRVEHYGYELSPHKEILSYDISQTSRFKMDDDVCLAVSIFNEMTFCGITEESHSEKINSIYEEINEAENAIETNPEQFKSLNDLFEELGWKDERTEEEKDFSYSIDVIEGKTYSQVYNKYFEMEKYYLTK